MRGSFRDGFLLLFFNIYTPFFALDNTKRRCEKIKLVLDDESKMENKFFFIRIDRYKYPFIKRWKFAQIRLDLWKGFHEFRRLFWLLLKSDPIESFQNTIQVDHFCVAVSNSETVDEIRETHYNTWKFVFI